jgi:hypothetical protein
MTEKREEAGSLAPLGMTSKKSKNNRNRKTHNKSTSSPASTEPELLRYG